MDLGFPSVHARTSVEATRDPAPDPPDAIIPNDVLPWQVPSSKPIIGTLGWNRSRWVVTRWLQLREFIHAKDPGNWGIIGRHFLSKYFDYRIHWGRERERCTEYDISFFLFSFFLNQRILIFLWFLSYWSNSYDVLIRWLCKARYFHNCRNGI